MTPAAARWTTIVFFVVVSAVLAAWAAAVPVFEAADEPAHWEYARYLHDHWSLPLYQPGFEEANSPPIYYLAIAPMAVASKLPPMALAQNVDGAYVSLAPPRVFQHSDRDRDWYWPVLAARLITMIMALVAVWLTYRAAAELTDWRGGIVAAATMAFLPQFSYRCVTVSNDVAVTMFAAAVTWTSVRLLRRGFTWRRGIVAAVMVAAAYLSKISAIALLAPLSLAILEAPATDASATGRASRTGLVWRLAVLLVALAIVLPWSIRNVRLYGDPFAQEAMKTVVSHLITPRSLFSTYFAWHFPFTLTLSFIGIFGWMNVLLPAWMYVVYVTGGAIAAAGVVRAWRTRTVDRRVVRTLVLTMIAVIAIVVHINLTFTQPQGRYLLPALPAMVLLATLGVRSLPARVATHAHAVMPVVLALLNVWCLVSVLVPAYYPPLTRDLAPGVRAVFPVAAFGLRLASAAPSDLRFRIASEDPGWLLTDDIDAASFSTLDLSLTSDVPGAPTVQGRVFFAGPGQAIGGTRTMAFTWTANGAPQTVHLDLGAHPDWRGPIAHLRIDPIDVGAGALIGRDVSLGTVLLHKPASADHVGDRRKVTKP